MKMVLKTNRGIKINLEIKINKEIIALTGNLFMSEMKILILCRGKEFKAGKLIPNWQLFHL